jgi:hypothetical protein
MSKRIISLLLVVISILALAGCGDKNGKLEIDTMVGKINASDYYNWSKYEEGVVEKVKLDKEFTEQLDKRVKELEDGTAPDAEIKEIEASFGSIQEYKKQTILAAKKNQLRQEVEKSVEVTDEDIEYFIKTYSDTFGSRNAIVFQFNSPELASTFLADNIGKSKEEVLKYIGNIIDKADIKWEEINSLKDETGIELLTNAESNMYNYCAGEKLQGVFDNLQTGQMSEVFSYYDVSTVLWRISDKVIEKDDSIITDYMKKIKVEEAYKKYIIDNK